MSRKEEYKLQNEQFLEQLRTAEGIKELPCGILYNNLCTAFLQFRISFSVSSGCFLVPPLSMVFTILKPLHFRISLKAFTTPCV